MKVACSCYFSRFVDLSRRAYKYWSISWLVLPFFLGI